MPDQPAAEQRRHLQVGIAIRQRERESSVDPRPLGKSTVQLITREAGVVAEVLAPAGAMLAAAARPPQPRHTHPLAHGQAFNEGPELFHDPDDLMPEHPWQLRLGKLPISDVQVRAAQAATKHAQL